MSAPDVTVVIPTSGRWHFVETALRVVALQEDVQTETVVVANGLRAHEWEDVAALHAEGVRVIVAPEPNAAAARNVGMQAARGNWIALLDDDDVWAPRKLADQLQALAASGADFAYSTAAIVMPDMRLRWIDSAPDPDELDRHMIENNPIPACASNLIVRADLARATPFDTELNHFADWDFAVRLIASGRGAAVRELHVGYLWHDDSMHTRRLGGIEREFRRFRAKHRRAGRRLGGPSQSRWIAGSYRESRQRLRAAGAYLRGAARYRTPVDALRAVAVLLGEPAMRFGARRRPPRPVGPEPGWLALYRP